jgi:hypothetical protein
MVRCRVGQRALNQPARHGARSSGSCPCPESERRAGLALGHRDHVIPTFDEERDFVRTSHACEPTTGPRTSRSCARSR